jgi:hypothetical protein
MGRGVNTGPMHGTAQAAAEKQNGNDESREIAFAFAVLVDHADSDEPARDMMCREIGEAIERACYLAKSGTTAYVYQLATIAEPSYELTVVGDGDADVPPRVGGIVAGSGE